MAVNTSALLGSLRSPGERVFHQMEACASCSTASVLPRSQGSDGLVKREAQRAWKIDLLHAGFQGFCFLHVSSSWT